MLDSVLTYDTDVLQAAAKAMVQWHGDGGMSEQLSTETLRAYFSDVTEDGKRLRLTGCARPKGGAPRRHHSAIVRVARLLQQRGSELVELMESLHEHGAGRSPSKVAKISALRTENAAAAADHAFDIMVRDAELAEQTKAFELESKRLAHCAAQSKHAAGKATEKVNSRVASRQEAIEAEAKAEAQAEAKKVIEKLKRQKNNFAARARASDSKCALLERDASARLDRAIDAETECNTHGHALMAGHAFRI